MVALDATGVRASPRSTRTVTENEASASYLPEVAASFNAFRSNRSRALPGGNRIRTNWAVRKIISESFSQDEACSVQSRLYTWLGFLQHFSNIRTGQFFDIPQKNDGSVVVRKLLERSTQCGSSLFPQQAVIWQLSPI